MSTGKNRFAGKALSTLTHKTSQQAHPLSHGDFSARVYISEIPLNAIEANPDQPRGYFNKEALEELAISIKSKGVLKPVIVQEIEEGKRYRLVAGERRWRACKIAGKTKIPAIIKHHDPGEELIIALIENIQRENLTPSEECRGFGKLLKGGMSQTEIAESTGKSLSHLSRCSKIAQFVDQYFKKHKTVDLRLSNGAPISFDSLLQAASMESYEEGEKLLQSILKGNLTVPEARQLRKDTSVHSTSKNTPQPLSIWLKKMQKVIVTPFSPSFSEKELGKGADKDLEQTIEKLSVFLEQLKTINKTRS